MAEKRKRGRQSKYTEELAEEICERLAAGESLMDICEDDCAVAESTVRGWVLDDLHGFAAKYTRARDIGLDHENDALLRVARDGSKDYKLVDRGENGQELVPDHEHINRSRLIVDTMKWRLSKMAPKKYGDKVQQEISGPDGGAIPTKVTIEFV